MKRNPKKILLNGWTNDLKSQVAPEYIANEITELAVSLTTRDDTVDISGIVARGDHWKNKVSELNKNFNMQI